MLRIVLLVTLAAFSAATPAVADEFYEMLVTLDPEGHGLEGQQWIRWTNSGDVPTSELWWHLYLNAFSNSSTTFMRDLGGGYLRRAGTVEHMTWGWTRITSMALADGTDLLASMEFMRPDDGNSGDFTVARVILPEPVPPGASVDIETSSSPNSQRSSPAPVLPETSTSLGSGSPSWGSLRAKRAGIATNSTQTASFLPILVDTG